MPESASEEAPQLTFKPLRFTEFTLTLPGADGAVISTPNVPAAEADACAASEAFTLKFCFPSLLTVGTTVRFVLLVAPAESEIDDESSVPSPIVKFCAARLNVAGSQFESRFVTLTTYFAEVFPGPVYPTDGDK